MYIDQSSKNLNRLFLKTLHESLTLKVKRVLREFAKPKSESKYTYITLYK